MALNPGLAKRDLLQSPHRPHLRLGEWLIIREDETDGLAIVLHGIKWYSARI
jgi:hypothetical protein